jgi:hypothetical protein
MLRKDQVATQLRRVADKLERYENSKGSKIGWDGGLHAFMRMLNTIEETLDKNAAKAAAKANLLRLKA